MEHSTVCFLPLTFYFLLFSFYFAFFLFTCCFYFLLLLSTSLLFQSFSVFAVRQYNKLHDSFFPACDDSLLEHKIAKEKAIEQKEKIEKEHVRIFIEGKAYNHETRQA